MPTINADQLESFVADIFVAAGCGAEEGARIGKYLVSANLTGHDSHGAQRVPKYVERMQAGDVHPNRTVAMLVDTPSLAVIDGKHGFGQTVAPQAVTIGIDKAKQNAIAMIALRNAGHIGRVGDWAEMAANAGILTVHFVNANGSILVAPFGGVDRRFSTAPMCIGVPRKGAPPLILDFATSQVAEGKVLNASYGGKALPDDAMIGPEGKISGDPHELYGDYQGSGPRNYLKGKGAIRAFGNHKGSGLALMCELLGGALTGNGATELNRPLTNGMLSFYIDPSKVDVSHVFDGEIERYLAYVRASRPVKSGGEILLPGEPEIRMRAERRANGIPLPQDTWDSILATARKLGVDGGRIKQIEVPLRSPAPRPAPWPSGLAARPSASPARRPACYVTAAFSRAVSTDRTIYDSSRRNLWLAA